VIHKLYKNQIDWKSFWGEIKDNQITIVSGRSSCLFIFQKEVVNSLRYCNVEGSYLLNRNPLKQFFVSHHGGLYGVNRYSEDFECVTIPDSFHVIAEHSTGIFSIRLAQNLFDEYEKQRSEIFKVTGFKC
jgi:hypothetical protein